MIFVDTTRKADIHYVMGGTGSGKSHHVKKTIIANDPRILIFDPDDEYGDVVGVKTFYSTSEMLEAVKKHRTSPYRARLVAEGQEAFEFVNQLAFWWTNCTLVVEEIADVTTPSMAPPKWAQVVRRGRKRAIKIVAVTQRPANADKVILTQATTIRTGLLGRDADRKGIANELNIPVGLINQMVPLDFIEFSRHDLSVYCGNAKKGTRNVYREPVAA